MTVPWGSGTARLGGLLQGPAFGPWLFDLDASGTYWFPDFYNQAIVAFNQQGKEIARILCQELSGDIRSFRCLTNGNFLVLDSGYLRIYDRQGAIVDERNLLPDLPWFAAQIENDLIVGIQSESTTWLMRGTTLGDLVLRPITFRQRQLSATRFSAWGWLALDAKQSTFINSLPDLIPETAILHYLSETFVLWRNPNEDGSQSYYVMKPNRQCVQVVAMDPQNPWSYQWAIPAPNGNALIMAQLGASGLTLQRFTLGW
jgi:hypothetical protein